MISWYWDWVPAAASDDWTASLVKLLDEWLGVGVDAPEMGAALARDLLARTDGMPANCRLIWGGGFLEERPRWLPLLILAEFRPARPEDPAYLMAEVGAEGFADDVRPPTVDYLTTERGDGVRVFAMASSNGEGLHGRVNAALRLDDQAVDVLLTTRVKALDQLAVIGSGVEAVMHMIATQPLEFIHAGL
ncbi:hypothetical protein [Paractinoplanes toevensis]|uniref:Uncharacterized protein n=1 Tax=Paractinoplanes toevensis TaxID=571911 RepID=A0A919W9K3_9ACTN|nr:hypothetical protein [Actinoplanes toevensis]GIM96077.1 hypothetical protein Ato02nite_078700 [Actinoplanes toevensis]